MASAPWRFASYGRVSKRVDVVRKLPQLGLS
jgi:hypothetical protein